MTNKSLTIVPGNHGIYLVRIPSGFQNITCAGETIIPVKERIRNGFQYFRIESTELNPFRIAWQ